MAGNERLKERPESMDKEILWRWSQQLDETGWWYLFLGVLEIRRDTLGGSADRG